MDERGNWGRWPGRGALEENGVVGDVCEDSQDMGWRILSFRICFLCSTSWVSSKLIVSFLFLPASKKAAENMYFRALSHTSSLPLQTPLSPAPLTTARGPWTNWHLGGRCWPRGRSEFVQADWVFGCAWNQYGHYTESLRVPLSHRNFPKQLGATGINKDYKLSHPFSCSKSLAPMVWQEILSWQEPSKGLACLICSIWGLAFTDWPWARMSMFSSYFILIHSTDSWVSCTPQTQSGFHGAARLLDADKNQMQKHPTHLRTVRNFISLVSPDPSRTPGT